MPDAPKQPAQQAASSSAEKVSPSAFMRKLRPEYYSDTKDRVSYVLEAPLLEFHLQSITERNQTHDFEIFCRKLCERTICPNLRPQSGPEGGGDSKADADTYPVADEIASLIYMGQANGGRERWAFAFSAKAKWAEKARNDVAGIVETGRNYDKIFFVTSRVARAKDRARVEDELTRKHKVPIAILDRSWIVREIIENDRRDLAFNYLKLGEAKADPLRLGPTDYSRTQQLVEIERLIEDPDAFRGMESQRVTEALVAAKLSRNLERPRTEIDGRFVRAIRLAEANGTYRQKLEAHYEAIWTAFWWFDDFRLLNSSYDTFETLALKSDHAKNIEFLCNLHQLLINAIVHGHMTREECHLDRRAATLKRALEPIAANEDRPNNALEAQSSLLIIRLGQMALDRNKAAQSSIWRDFTAVFEKAEGLLEFDPDGIVKVVEVAGNFAGNDPAYNELVEKMAAFVAKRRSEAEGALILLKRAQKLDFTDRFDMIRLLGKAAAGLTKKEHLPQLIEALQLLTLAYRSAGLLWAARASCLFVIASIIMEGEEDSRISVDIVPTLKIWAWIAVELNHLLDLLFGIQLLNGALAKLPLDDESKQRVAEDISELDAALGSVLLNMGEPELRKLEGVPDILEALGLFMARASLLYILGYQDHLRTDGSTPETQSDDETHRLLSGLAGQPVGKQVRRLLVLNSDADQTYATQILGMTVEVECDGSLDAILIVEAVLGGLDTFFSTVLEQRVAAHTERFKITLRLRQDAAKPSFKVDEMDFRGVLTWPAALRINAREQQGKAIRFLIEVAAQVLGATCFVEDGKSFLKNALADEAVLQRMMITAVAANSYHRMASRSISRLADWDSSIRTTFKVRGDRPTLTPVSVPVGEECEADEHGHDPKGEAPPAIKDHRAIRVRSVIDVHAWDAATWRGAAYLQFSPDQPPGMALTFENRDAARKIFERWRERFGNRDTNDEIHIAIVRELPNEPPHHYCMVITSKRPDADETGPNQILTIPSRSLVMTPESDQNLQRFLRSYERFGVFFLLPALMIGKPMPELFTDLALLKRGLIVKRARDVGSHDYESVAFNRPPGH